MQIVDSFTNFMCEGFDFHQAADYIDSLKDSDTQVQVFVLADTSSSGDDDCEWEQFRKIYTGFLVMFNSLVRRKEKERKKARAEKKKWTEMMRKAKVGKLYLRTREFRRGSTDTIQWTM